MKIDFELLKRIDAAIDTLAFGRPLGMVGEKILNPCADIKDEKELKEKLEHLRESIGSISSLLSRVQGGIGTLSSMIEDEKPCPPKDNDCGCDDDDYDDDDYDDDDDDYDDDDDDCGCDDDDMDESIIGREFVFRHNTPNMKSMRSGEIVKDLRDIAFRINSEVYTKTINGENCNMVQIESLCSHEVYEVPFREYFLND